MSHIMRSDKKVSQIVSLSELGGMISERNLHPPWPSLIEQYVDRDHQTGIERTSRRAPVAALNHRLNQQQMRHLRQPSIRQGHVPRNQRKNRKGGRPL